MATYVFYQRFVRERRPKLQFFHGLSYCSQRGQTEFGQFALGIGLSANYEKCVPENNEQLSYWPILNFYSEIWRTRKKTKSALKEI
jgi:hypothetical protein